MRLQHLKSTLRNLGRLRFYLIIIYAYSTLDCIALVNIKYVLSPATSAPIIEAHSDFHRASSSNLCLAGASPCDRSAQNSTTPRRDARRDEKYASKAPVTSSCISDCIALVAMRSSDAVYRYILRVNHRESCAIPPLAEVTLQRKIIAACVAFSGFTQLCFPEDREKLGYSP